MTEPLAVAAIRESLSLAEEQARAYWYLISRRQGTAHEISDTCRISRGRVYEVLRDLEERGLVGRLPTSPTVYRPVDPDEALRSAEDRFRTLADQAAAARERILHTPAAPVDVPDPTGVLLLLRRRAAAERFEREVRSAARSLHVIQSNRFAEQNRGWIVPVLGEKSRDLETFRVLINRGPHAGFFEELSAMGVPVRWASLPDEGVSICVADRSRNLFIRFRANDPTVRDTGEYGFESTDPVMGKFFAELIERIWLAEADGAPSPASVGKARQPSTKRVPSASRT